MVTSTQEEFILSNKKSWDEVAPRFFGRTALPTDGPFAPLEEDLNSFGEVSKLKVLDVGGGSVTLLSIWHLAEYRSFGELIYRKHS